MNKKTIILIVASIIIAISSMVLVFLKENKKTVTYDIIFETDGGSFVRPQTVKEGESAQKPKDPEKKDYAFVEWRYKGKTYDFSQKVKSDLTLTAKWTELKKDIETYIVKFETDGGTTFPNQVIEKGKKVTKPTDPKKEDYEFEGWTLDGEKFDFETIIDKNIELKAEWTKVKDKNDDRPSSSKREYTISFDSNGGSPVEKQIIESGRSVTRPTDPVRDGYEFVEWQINGSAYDFNNKVNSNITLKASWKELPPAMYTVTFDSSGGEQIASQTVQHGNSATRPIDPARDGYAFKGWHLENGNTYDFNEKVYENITLIATWKLKDYYFELNNVTEYSVTVQDGSQDIISINRISEQILGHTEFAPNADLYSIKYLVKGLRPGEAKINIELKKDSGQNTIASESYTISVSVDDDLCVTYQSRENY